MLVLLIEKLFSKKLNQGSFPASKGYLHF